jgi:hypothetical protein
MLRTKLSLALALAGCAALTPALASDETYDLVIRNGVVYDGSGAAPRQVDVAVRGDRIAALLPPGSAVTAARSVDAHGQAVAPGFINMLSWANESLIADGRGMSDTKQGVTLEIFGEGWSMGPLNPAMKAEALKQQGDIRYPIEWTTLGDYLGYLEKRGITPNVASFVGATTVRIHELGEGDVKPDATQLAHMQDLVRDAMAEGALGVGGSLIYPPATFRQHRGTDRAGESRGGVRRWLHRAHAQRSRSLPRGARRKYRHRPRHRAARRVLPFESGRREELAEDGAGDREDRGGAQGRRARQRRHVRLHRRRHRTDRRTAALGPGRRQRRHDRAPEGSGDAQARDRGDEGSGRGLGKHPPAHRLRRAGAADRSQERQAQAAARQDAGGNRAPARHRPRRKPSST